MKAHLFAACAAAVSLVAVQAQAPDPRLTIAEVEHVANVSGVHMVGSGAIPGAGGGLNFVTADNKMLVMVNFGTDVLYKRAKEQKEQEIGGMKLPMVLYHADVKGIGDEAFDCPPGPYQYVLYIRKGSRAVSLTTYIDTASKRPRLTMAQLEALGKIVVSRL